METLSVVYTPHILDRFHYLTPEVLYRSVTNTKRIKPLMWKQFHYSLFKKYINFGKVSLAEAYRQTDRRNQSQQKSHNVCTLKWWFVFNSNLYMDGSLTYLCLTSVYVQTRLWNYISLFLCLHEQKRRNDSSNYMELQRTGLIMDVSVISSTTLLCSEVYLGIIMNTNMILVRHVTSLTGQSKALMVL